MFTKYVFVIILENTKKTYLICFLWKGELDGFGTVSPRSSATLAPQSSSLLLILRVSQLIKGFAAHKQFTQAFSSLKG